MPEIWITCIAKDNKSLNRNVQKITYSAFKKILNSSAVMDYSTVIREFMVKCGGSFNEQTSEYSVGPKNEYTAKSVVSVAYGVHSRTSIGFGRNNREAINNACRDLIPSLLPDFNDDPDSLNMLLNYVTHEVRVLYNISTSVLSISTEDKVQKNGKEDQQNILKKKMSP